MREVHLDSTISLSLSVFCPHKDLLSFQKKAIFHLKFIVVRYMLLMLFIIKFYDGDDDFNRNVLDVWIYSSDNPNAIFVYNYIHYIIDGGDSTF